MKIRCLTAAGTAVNALSLLIMLTTCLSGCMYIPRPAFIQNRDAHYLSATSIPPLKIPPGLSSHAFHNFYPIPTRVYPESAKSVSLIPPELNEDP